MRQKRHGDTTKKTQPPLHNPPALNNPLDVALLLINRPQLLLLQLHRKLQRSTPPPFHNPPPALNAPLFKAVP